jgi:hypothetical protein
MDTDMDMDGQRASKFFKNLFGVPLQRGKMTFSQTDQNGSTCSPAYFH